MADDFAFCVPYRSLRLSCGGNGGRVLGCSIDSILLFMIPKGADVRLILNLFLLSPLGASVYHVCMKKW